MEEEHDTLDELHFGHVGNKADADTEEDNAEDREEEDDVDRGDCHSEEDHPNDDFDL